MDEYLLMLLEAAEKEQTDTPVAGEYVCTDAGVTFTVTGNGAPLGASEELSVAR